MSQVDQNSAPQLVQEIAAALSTIPPLGEGFAATKLYTDALIKGLAHMGRSRKFSVHPDPTQVGFYKEYLFDSSWWFGSDLCMAAESEWGDWNAVKYDFPKLLVAKSPLKILITDAGHNRQHRTMFQSNLEQMLRDYRGHSAGERYLWIDVEGTIMGGELHGFEARTIADGKHPEISFVRTSPESFQYDFAKG